MCNPQAHDKSSKNHLQLHHSRIKDNRHSRGHDDRHPTHLSHMGPERFHRSNNIQHPARRSSDLSTECSIRTSPIPSHIYDPTNEPISTAPPSNLHPNSPPRLVDELHLPPALHTPTPNNHNKPHHNNKPHPLPLLSVTSRPHNNNDDEPPLAQNAQPPLQPQRLAPSPRLGLLAPTPP